MELDKRVKEGKRPLTCFDLKEAEPCIGEDGYFAHEMEVFENLDRCYFSRLLGFDTCDKSIPFAVANASRDYEFFLPAEWVKEPEKKYRPYTLAEWIDQHEIGEVIHCRNEHKQEFHVMYTGYVIDNGEDTQDIRTTGRIMLINMGYLLQELFERYEICINGEWQPFGVVEDD